MFFNDAQSCKEWLATVSTTNVHQAQQSVLDALRILNREAGFTPIARLTCMELLRDKVAALLAEQRTRYSGKMIPLAAGEYGAWNVSRQLIDEMESGYRRCWGEAAQKDAPLVTHAALIIQRIIRAIGLQMLIAGFIYRPFSPSLWTRLHLMWREAEARDLTSKRVKDSIGAINGNSSVTQAYTAVLLGQMANICELTPRQIDFVDAVMKRFGHKVIIGTEAPANITGPVCAVDLLSSTGASFRVGSGSSGIAEHIRVLDMTELSKSLRHRAKRLIDGEEPKDMDLPDDWTPTDARNQLVRLHRLWCEGAVTRGAGLPSAEKEVVISFGLAETHFFVCGDVFEQPDVARELTRQEMSEIRIFGKVSEATQRSRVAGFHFSTETWPIIDETRASFRLARPPKSARGVAIGCIVGQRIGKKADFYLGVVRELFEEADGKFIVTIALLPGKPEAIAVRAADTRHRGSGQYMQGFRLPPNEALKIAETLVIPHGFVQRGRGIDLFARNQSGPVEVTLADFVERGTDFDRVTIS